MLRTGALILALLLLAQPWSGAASDKTVLMELDLRSSAQPLGVSSGGAVVVGGLGTGGGFYWMPTTGVIFAGGLFATKVSRDGKVIVGQAIDARLRQAAIWQRGAEWRSLGSFPNALPCDTFLSAANDTSRDGRVVVGLREQRVSRWRTHSGGKSRQAWSIWAPASRARLPGPRRVRGRAGCRRLSGTSDGIRRRREMGRDQTRESAGCRRFRRDRERRER